MNYCMSVLHMQTIYIRVHNLNALFFIPFIGLLNPPLPQCSFSSQRFHLHTDTKHTITHTTVDQLIFCSLSMLRVWNRCRWPISSPAGGRTSTDLYRERAAGWKSGEIMIIIMETYKSVGHSLNHREKEIVAFLYKWIPTDLYLHVKRRN